MNTECVKMRKSDNVIRRPSISTNGLRRYTVATYYTSNMVTVTNVGRTTTSLSPYVGLCAFSAE